MRALVSAFFAAFMLVGVCACYRWCVCACVVCAPVRLGVCMFMYLRVYLFVCMFRSVCVICDCVQACVYVMV